MAATETTATGDRGREATVTFGRDRLRTAVVFALVWGIIGDWVGVAFLALGNAQLASLAFMAGPGAGWLFAGALLVVYFGRTHQDLLAVGFGGFALYGVILAVITPLYGLGFVAEFTALFVGVWVPLVVGLLSISASTEFSWWNRGTGALSALAFIVTIVQGMYGIEFPVSGGFPPVYLAAYLLLWVTIFGWAYTVWTRTDSPTE